MIEKIIEKEVCLNSNVLVGQFNTAHKLLHVLTVTNYFAVFIKGISETNSQYTYSVSYSFDIADPNFFPKFKNWVQTLA